MKPRVSAGFLGGDRNPTAPKTTGTLPRVPDDVQTRRPQPASPARQCLVVPTKRKDEATFFKKNTAHTAGTRRASLFIEEQQVSKPMFRIIRS